MAFDAEDLGVERAFEADLDLMPDTTDVRRHRLAFVARAVPGRGHDVYRVALSNHSMAAPTWRPG